MTQRLDPCRFCGETERLTLSEGAFSELFWPIDVFGEVVRMESGEPMREGMTHDHGQDGVSCDICGALVPVLAWNGSPEFWAQARANILAADAEYDEAGVWQGKRAAA